MNETLTSWTLAPPVIKTIFENLPAKDLNSCSRVCSTWNREAHIIKKQRNSRISWYPPVGLDNSNQSCKEIAFVEHIRNLPFEPKYALIFKIKDLCSCENNHKSESYELLKHLPLSCERLFCSSAGIADHARGYVIIDELLKDNESSALFLPHFPGVEINIFNFKGVQRDLDFTSEDSCKEKLVKCLFGFHTGNALTYEEVGKLMRHHEWMEEGMVSAGIYTLRELKYQRGEYSSLPREQSFGMSFSGENLQASSVIIRAEVATAISIEESLKTLFGTSTFGGQSIAFAFTSIGNTQPFPLSQKLGHTIFKKLYPSIPLFCLYGLGTICRNSCLSTASDYDDFSIFTSIYTTVYVLISVRN